MHKIREILRLRLDQKQELRAVALSVGASPSTVHGHVARALNANITTWDEVKSLTDVELRARMFPGGRERKVPGYERADFDPGYVHKELRRVGVTLLLLWQEYVERASHGTTKPYSYSQFCDRYSLYKKQLGRSVRQVHRAGEKMFVDYSGKKPHLIDEKTGEVREVELFVAALGASSYTFAEATLSQGLHDFCSSVMRTCEHFGGSPEVLVPDQLRSAVRGPCRYDPDINRTLQKLAEHYSMTVLPARPRKPKDKAKVEVAVLIAQRWILAKIRNETFHTLDALNERIGELLEALNARPFQKLDGSRVTLFETLDRGALRPLPSERFCFGEWKKAKVHIDGHVALFERYYSVPSQLVGEPVEVHFSANFVEIYADGERIASHVRSFAPKGTAVSIAGHMSEAERHAQNWSPERVLAWARTHGAHVEGGVKRLLDSYARPQFGYRAALGIIRLADRYGSDALDSACERALKLSAVAPRRRLLEAYLKQNKAEQRPSRGSLGIHENIRGGDYFTPDPFNKPSPEEIH